MMDLDRIERLVSLATLFEADKAFRGIAYAMFSEAHRLSNGQTLPEATPLIVDPTQEAPDLGYGPQLLLKKLAIVVGALEEKHLTREEAADLMLRLCLAEPAFADCSAGIQASLKALGLSSANR